MILSTSVRRLLQVFLFTIAMSLGSVSAAHAIIVNFNWTDSDNGVTATGTFEGFDNNTNDGFIRGGNLNGNSNEITTFDITFRNSANTLLANYNITDLLSFNPDFNFNYEISTNQILQSGNSFENTGFSIGSSDLGGYLLDTTSGVIDFTDYNNNTINVSGGTVTATPVPFESNSGLGFVSIGSLWMLNQWRKKRFQK
jgi:hypothetical protein